MNINQRIKALRKDNKLTQVEFGERIGLKQSAASKLEQDGATVIDQNIRLICDTFHVRERWLRTGEGEKEAGSDDELWKKIREKFFLHGFSEEIARAWFELDDEKREDVARKVEAVASTLKAHMKEGKSAEDARKEYEAQKHAELDVALELQKKVAASSSPTIATEKRA
ncbi:helix-turn-helix domain-containing protein [Selenomonas sp.]|uniref:helix-turn-helix domain-containing protein n=2 Tax=Selenomonas sp. TaxID=2053611 RepID=UPI0025DDDB11|nr:helix-turn-helix domain-containing protein [Selenomonas sp.]MCI6284022.1 helix-turn-helix domain-containing protein [Selenomonas sp.]